MTGIEFAKTTPFVHSLYDFSEQALQEIRNWLEVNPPSLPISNVLGFSQFTAQAERTETESSFNSTTYADPNVSGPAGPAISGLSNGLYVVFFGCSLAGGAGGTQQSFANISINAAVPADDTQAIEAQQTNHASVSGATLVSLSAGSNTLNMVFRNPAGNTIDVRYRWIVALRYANA